MTLKNSFWANMRENLKRRNGITVIFSVVFLLAYPVGWALFVSSMTAYNNSGNMLGNEVYVRMSKNMADYLGMNPMTAVLVTIMAVICAVQGFSYLFRRQKMDMYMSVPVSKERRFGVIYLNGILMYAVPFLVSILIAVGIGAANGFLTANVVKVIIYSYLAFLLYYIAVYNITVIAVMLTGNLIISLCATAMLLFYEIMIKGIFVGMCSTFFRTYSSYTMEESMKVYVSPVILFFEKFMTINSKDLTVPYLLEETGMVLVKILIITVVTGVTGYVLYAVRPAESCHNAIAFRKTKPVIKILLMVPITLVTGLLFHDISGGNTPMTLLGFSVGIVISHGIVETIFEFDLKAILKHFVSSAAAAVLVAGIFIVFKFDLTGYDKWVPEAEKVESAAIYMGALSSGDSYDLERGYWYGSGEYSFDKMKLTDTETLCRLMEAAVNEKPGEEEKKVWTSVKYRMKNGKEKYRQLPVSYEKYMEELNTLTGSEEYRKGMYQILDDSFNANTILTEVGFSNGVTGTTIEKADAELVLENYKKDLAGYNFEAAATEIPIGTMYLEFEDKTEKNRSGYYFTYTLPVYPSYKNTIAYAEENGCLKDWREQLAEAGIDKVILSHSDEESYEWIEEEYTDAEQIKQILPALYPSQIAEHIMFTGERRDWSAYIHYNSIQEEGENGEETIYPSSTAHFEVNYDLLPDFIK